MLLLTFAKIHPSEVKEWDDRLLFRVSFLLPLPASSVIPGSQIYSVLSVKVDG